MLKRGFLKFNVDLDFDAQHLVKIPFSGILRNNIQDDEISASSHLLYVRDEVTILWKALDDSMSKKNNIIVKGSPGCGKSLAAWAWALSKASIAWVGFLDNNINSVRVAVTCNGNIWFSDRIGFEDFTSLKKSVLEVLTDFNAGIVLFDGVSAYTLNFVRNASFASYHLILISSEQLKALDTSKQLVTTVEHRVNPWNLNEYDSLCQIPLFFSSLQPEIMPDSSDFTSMYQKYYIAGASARWMFDEPYETLPKFVNSFIDQVDDPIELLKLNIGSGASKTVNHLLIQFRDQKKAIVSQFVAEMLAKQAKDLIVFSDQVASFAAALDDRGMMGSAFEVHFRSQVRQAFMLSNPNHGGIEKNKKIAILDRDSGEIFDFDVMDIREFWQDGDIIGLKHVHGQWLFTMNKYHGGFDLIYFHEKAGKFIIYFFQITISEEHELKCKYFAKTAKIIAENMLKVGNTLSSIVVAGLVTFSRARNFRFTTYTTKDLESIGQNSAIRSVPVEIKIFHPSLDPYFTYKF
jgi:hypothetical protein